MLKTAISPGAPVSVIFLWYVKACHQQLGFLCWQLEQPAAGQPPPRLYMIHITYVQYLICGVRAGGVKSQSHRHYDSGPTGATGTQVLVALVHMCID